MSAFSLRLDSHLSRQRTGLTWIELVFGLAAGVLVTGLVLALMLPSVGRGREAARRTQCKSNLKQIGLALHNYHDTYGMFPPAYTVDADGKPLHSWRTLILPYLEHAPRYNSLDLSKSPDDPANAAEFQYPMPTYSCPSMPTPPGQTTYLAVVTPDSILQPGKSRSLSGIGDGTSNTILVIEVPFEHAVSWMSPQDADESLILQSFQADSKQTQHSGGAHALFADGTVRFLSSKIEPATLKALLTANSREQIGEF